MTRLDWLGGKLLASTLTHAYLLNPAKDCVGVAGVGVVGVVVVVVDCGVTQLDWLGGTLLASTLTHAYLPPKHSKVRVVLVVMVVLLLLDWLGGKLWLTPSHIPTC